MSVVSCKVVGSLNVEAAQVVLWRLGVCGSGVCCLCCVLVAWWGVWAALWLVFDVVVPELVECPVDFAFSFLEGFGLFASSDAEPEL